MIQSGLSGRGVLSEQGLEKPERVAVLKFCCLDESSGDTTLIY